jgi:hypothetical protein
MSGYGSNTYVAGYVATRQHYVRYVIGAWVEYMKYSLYSVVFGLYIVYKTYLAYNVQDVVQ